MKTLVIVESRAKGDKIQDYLGGEYIVKACYGHVRDLPRDREEIPEALRGEKWANLGIDIQNGFKLLYVTPRFREGVDRVDTAKVVGELRALARKVGRTVLATDPDREGETIAADLADELHLGENAARVTFNEITPGAVQAALASPRRINRELVAAQQARRALDRLCGYSVSPVLGRVVRKGSSAGRVQSAALAALVKQELARMRHVAGGYVRLTASLAPEGGAPFTAALLSRGGTPLATPKDFGEDGQLKEGASALVLTEAQGREIVAGVQGGAATVSSAERTPYATRPPAPFTTSTMQQEASKQLGLDPKETMELAQTLYEAGKITYMRTDSPVLSAEATQAARNVAAELFGEGAVPESARVYAARGQNAQEAHEAVRPAGKVFVTPEQSGLTDKALGLYDLIYRRTVASQMTDLTGLKSTVYVTVPDPAQEGELVFGAVGRVVLSPGFTRLYQDAREGAGVETSETQELPDVTAGAVLGILSAAAEVKKTPAPKRYTQASLVAALERAEVGRPSTYVSVLDTLSARGYTTLVGGAARQLAVTWVGLLVSRYLEDNFPLLTNTQFTAQMEAQLDQIASGGLSYAAYLDHFWTQELSPVLAAAEARPPVVALPRVPGAVVGIKGGVPTLKLDNQYMPIPDHVMPEDLTPEVAARIMRGEAVPKKRASKADKAEGGEKKPRAPRKKSAPA